VKVPGTNKNSMNTNHKSELIRHSGIMFTGMMIVNISNMLFQAVMGRRLSADEYGILNALLGILNIFFIPLSVVSAGLGRYSSLLAKGGRVGDIRRLVFKWLLILGGVGMFLSLLCFVFSGSIAGFLHLDRRAPILITGFVLLGIFCRPVVGGALHGLQYFTLYSLFHAISSLIRLVAGVLLVTLIAAAAGWGLLGHGIGAYTALATGSVFLIRSLIHQPTTTEPLPSLKGYMVSAFLSVLGYAVLMTGDVVIVKHLYPADAGEFAYAAILGKMVVFIPQAFAMTMFPKVVAEKGASPGQWKMFMYTLFLTLLSTIAGAVGLSILPKLAFRLLFGMADPAPQTVAWCIAIGWTMIPVALVNVVLRFYMALNRFVVLSLIPTASLLFIASVFIWKGSAWSLIVSLASISSCLLGLLLVACFRDRPKGGAM
jgi:O-antigen/teichoic acid export membrane protein